MDTNIIIVSNNPMSSWLETVSEALSTLGDLYYPSEREAANCIGEFDPDLILIDASSMEDDVAALVEQIHQQKKQIPIIVATTSPTWRRARAVIRAGAADYVRRSFDKEMIVEKCREQLQKRPSCLDDP